MKRTYLFVLVLIGMIMAGQAFAEGQSEEGTFDDQWDTITVTGTISFKDLPHPEITSRGDTYELVVPRFAASDIEIEAGDTLTITGVLVDTPADTDEPLLMVRTATIDGEEYEVPYALGPRGHMGMPHGRLGDDGWSDDRPMGDRFGGRDGRRF